MKKTSLALLALAVAGTASAQKGGGGTFPQPAPCIQTVVSNARPSGSILIAPLLPALETLDADVVVRVPRSFDLSQPQPVELRFLTPSGSLYQSMTIVAQAGGGEAPTLATMKVATYPEPLRVQQAKPSSDDTAFEVHASLPVAGTHIVRNALYGTWTIRTVFAGRDVTCTKGTDFRIAP